MKTNSVYFNQCRAAARLDKWMDEHARLVTTFGWIAGLCAVGYIFMCG